jgi:glycosyltransferase involved in cell wall biosynthesis
VSAEHNIPHSDLPGSDLPGEASEAAGRPPVVLQVLPALVTGGVERGTVEITQALVRAGWRAVVASAGGGMVHEIERAGGKHVALPLKTKNPFGIRRNIRLLAALIERENIDLVHARSRAPAWSAYFAAKRTGRPFMTTFHNVYGGQGRLKRWYNSIMARGVRVIAISEFVGRAATKTYGVEQDRLRVIPRGVDLARFDPETVHPSRLVQLTKEWQLKDGVPVVMLPGRVTRWKGHIDLLNAVQRLPHRDFQVVFVGDHEQKPAFRDELVLTVKRLGLQGHVRMVGDCRDMAAAFMLADVVVSASTEPEGFGRVAVEAQAMGRPLVATDHGGSRETVLPGITGWLVAPGDRGALSAAIGEALALTPEARAEMAAEARALMAHNFDTTLMCRATLAVYTEILFPDAVESLPVGPAFEEALG